jgi:cardiolipin synthase A/B
VRVYEYGQRPLHGKVAVIDDAWSTVGSSNLDPLSLSLNLEANVFVRDPAFNAELAGRLETLIEQHCKRIEVDDLVESSTWRLVRSFFVFHFLRWYPHIGVWLPRHAPRMHHAGPPADRAGSTRTGVA